MTETLVPPTARRITAVERLGWLLVSLLCAVMVVFGFGAYLTSQDPTTPITGSLCCTGERLSTVDPWVDEYVVELGRYLGTFMIGMGVLGLTVCAVPLRRRERWAWYVAWVVPALFAVHGFALGSFPFDIVPLAFTTLGLLLMVRPVFVDPRGEERPAVSG